MVRILVGDEPYMIKAAIKESKKEIMLPDVNICEFDVFSGEAYEYLMSVPLMDDKRIAVIRLDNLKKLDVPEFRSFLNSGSRNIAVVRVNEYDARTSFYKELKKGGYIEEFFKTSYINCLPDFLEKKALKGGFSFEKGVVEAMIGRCGYVENEAVSIYTLLEMLKILSATSKSITMEHMEKVVAPYHKEERFILVKLILEKDVKRLQEQANLLSGDAIAILSLLLREYRIAFKSKFYDLKAIGVTYSALSQKDIGYLKDSILFLTKTIKGIKQGTVIKEHCLLDAFLHLI